MAHNLEYNVERGTTSFFSRKELAWHGLGQIIQEAVSPEEALKLANLDYEVKLTPIWANHIPKGFTCSNVKTDLGYELVRNGIPTGNYIREKGTIVDGSKAICRTDNLEALGIVGNKYTPVQNIESLNFIYNILKLNPDISERNDIIIETAGALGKGERIFVTAKLPKGFTVGNEKDSTELYIVFTNSHNGKSSLTAMVTPIRVVCNNTLTAAMGNNRSKVSFMHTANIHNSMKEGAKLMNIAYENFNKNQELYNAMLGTTVNQNLVDEIICKSFLNDNQLDMVGKFGIDGVSTECISTRTRNTILEVRDFVDGGVGQTTNRGTLYWAYMGINSYLNNGVNFKDAENKFDNLLGGTASKQDAKVLQVCLDFI